MTDQQGMINDIIRDIKILSYNTFAHNVDDDKYRKLLTRHFQHLSNEEKGEVEAL